jgi:hypothetical protein
MSDLMESTLLELRAQREELADDFYFYMQLLEEFNIKDNARAIRHAWYLQKLAAGDKRIRAVLVADKLAIGILHATVNVFLTYCSEDIRAQNWRYLRSVDLRTVTRNQTGKGTLL